MPYKSPVQLLIDPNDRALMNDMEITIISFISFIGTSQRGHTNFDERFHEKKKVLKPLQDLYPVLSYFQLTQKLP